MITPYFTHGAVTLYKGDRRAGLREIAPESVALLLTDPPYGIAVESNQFENAATEWDKGDPTELVDEMLAAARPTMKTNGAFYVFAHPGQFFDARNQYTRAGVHAASGIGVGEVEVGSVAEPEPRQQATPGIAPDVFP